MCVTMPIHHNTTTTCYCEYISMDIALFLLQFASKNKFLLKRTHYFNTAISILKNKLYGCYKNFMLQIPIILISHM